MNTPKFGRHGLLRRFRPWARPSPAPRAWRVDPRVRLAVVAGAIGLAAAAAAPFVQAQQEIFNVPDANSALRADRALAEYFRAETASRAGRCLADIPSLAAWKARQGEYRRQLQEMLGLWPWPERSDLHAVVTGRLEHEEFTVEKLHFQALPRLYVTANLYVPRGLTNRAPAILYLCGHSRQITNGVSLGNKVGYQHHGAWFARHGYICLVFDTLQLGEIQGIHHGTYRHGSWWWNARGYTPAGVEAWFGIRALDYLCARPDVDGDRIGVTGRSGGGSYSWTVAALDDRVKVVAPVAGITDLQNHVVDGCVEGHCDCMFFVNTYRWDFSRAAALVAPRPLLMGNTDKDKIFPLDGVIRVHESVRRIYQLHDQALRLGLLIAEGAHQDTQDLHVPVLRWFNRWLKGDASSVIEVAAHKLFPPEQLKVFDTLPADELNTTIQEHFGPRPAPGPPGSADAVRAALLEKVFAGWPTEPPAMADRPVWVLSRAGLRLRAWDVPSQDHVTLRLYVLDKPLRRARSVSLEVLDEAGWTDWQAAMRGLFPNAAATPHKTPAGSQARLNRQDGPPLPETVHQWLHQLATHNRLAWFAPRGLGGDAWSGDERAQTQIRRRFMLLGQTRDGMRVWDIRRAVNALQFLHRPHPMPVTLRGRGQMGVNALYAALYEPSVRQLELGALPNSHREGPDYLNVLQVLDIPQALQLAARTMKVECVR